MDEYCESYIKIAAQDSAALAADLSGTAATLFFGFGLVAAGVAVPVIGAVAAVGTGFLVRHATHKTQKASFTAAATVEHANTDRESCKELFRNAALDAIEGGGSAGSLSPIDQHRLGVVMQEHATIKLQQQAQIHQGQQSPHLAIHLPAPRA